MRDANPQLIAFLLSKRPYYQADLFSFAFLNGVQPTLTLASIDQDVIDSTSGTTWHGSTPALGVAVLARDPAYPSVTKSRWNTKNTVEVPTLDLELNSDGSDYAGGLNIKAMAHNGLFDGGKVTFQRAIMPTFGNTSLGLVMMFQGPVGPVQVAARSVKLTVKGANVKLQQFMPRNRFQLGCIHALYDTGCTAARGDFTFANTVGVGSTPQRILWGSGVPATPSQFGLGYITMTSGDAISQIRTIQSGDAGGVTLMYPLYDVPAPGDTFTVAFGCDKTLATCTAVFNNELHYRGFPFIPPASMAV